MGRGMRSEVKKPCLPPPSSDSSMFWVLFFSLLILVICCSVDAQQQYENNAQLNCYANNGSSTEGYSCNGAQTSCTSYLTFRSQTNYQSPASIAELLNSDAANISRINGNISDVSPLPISDVLIVPTGCSCSGSGNKGYYQHNSPYTIKSTGETYLVIANDTYQGLSTCQALIAQNPSHESHNLLAGLTLRVPLRCACPTSNQTSSGIRYLLTYLITWGDDLNSISQRFNADVQSVIDANSLQSSASVIYPFTTLLVPLSTEPTQNLLLAQPPAPPPSVVPPPPTGSGSGNNKGVFIGIGIGAAFLLVCGFVGSWYLCCFRRHPRPGGAKAEAEPTIPQPSSAEHGYYGGGLSSVGKTPSSPPFEIRTALESLTLYKFEQLEKATGSFGEDHRIKGSVYRGVINGDDAAIKRLKGDVSSEINILKQINHSNVIRLSGFCLHQGNTYLVYEFADKGSLSDWLHGKNKDGIDSVLSWKQRVQIAYDIADGLNYLHHYASPPYVHKNLKSSNILLDGDFRAKVANFGLARPVDNWEEPQLTRHVTGTQGYMAPEYLEHGLITPKLDVFAFGVVMLELLSGKEATFANEGGKKGELLLAASIAGVLSGEDVRTKLRGFIDPCLQNHYPLDLAFATAEIALQCVSKEAASRPAMTEVLMSLSAIYDSTLDWDPSDVGHSGSMVYGR